MGNNVDLYGIIYYKSEISYFLFELIFSSTNAVTVFITNAPYCHLKAQVLTSWTGFNSKSLYLFTWLTTVF